MLKCKIKIGYVWFLDYKCLLQGWDDSTEVSGQYTSDLPWKFYTEGENLSPLYQEEIFLVFLSFQTFFWQFSVKVEKNAYFH